MSKDTGRVGAVVHRHQHGVHSKTCKTWDDNYKGFICRYSWEPHGQTAHEIATRPLKDYDNAIKDLFNE